MVFLSSVNWFILLTKRGWCGYCITYPRLPSLCSYFLAVSCNFMKYFNMTKSLQLHSHYKFCQGWVWIVLCSLEHKIRIFIAATVNTVWLKGIKRFLIKSWITDNWYFYYFSASFHFLKLFAVFPLSVYFGKLNKWFSPKWVAVHAPVRELGGTEGTVPRVRRTRINYFFNFLSFSWPKVWQLDLSKSGKTIWHTYICSHICQSGFIKNQWLKNTKLLKGANLWPENHSNAPFGLPPCGISFWF